jgi:FkbM family methyltransferase
MRWAAKLFGSIGESAGILVAPHWRQSRLDEERCLRKLFKHLGVDCVFDVGANVGQYGRMLRDYVGYEGRIISFEPNPDAFTKLETEVDGDELWQAENFALGESDHEAEFNAFTHSDLGSFRDLADSAHAPKNFQQTRILVQVRTLATYFAEAQRQLDFERPFLKLDTQGFDLEVAKGAGAALSRFVGLQSEIAFQPTYAGAPDYRTALDFYAAAGFVLTRLVPINDVSFPGSSWNRVGEFQGRT